MRLLPSPGYIICKPYTIESKKTGNFQVPKGTDDPEKAPEYGEIMDIGELTLKDQHTMEKLCVSNPHLDISELVKRQFPYKVGDKIGYKKYNYFTLNIGLKQYVAVNYENILFKIEETDV